MSDLRDAAAAPAAVGRGRGFTLIEVLVALAIAAIGLAAVLGVVTNSTRNASYLRDKTLAGWIALNRITEVRLATIMPAVERSSGELDYAGMNWQWTQTVTQTDVAGMRRIDVEVRHAGDAEASALVSVTGFVGRTQLGTPPSATSWDGDLGAGGPGGPGGVPNTPSPNPTPGRAPAPLPPTVPAPDPGPATRRPAEPPP